MKNRTSYPTNEPACTPLMADLGSLAGLSTLEEFFTCIIPWTVVTF